MNEQQALAQAAQAAYEAFQAEMGLADWAASYGKIGANERAAWEAAAQAAIAEFFRQPAPLVVNLDRRCTYGACPHKGAYRMIGGCYNCRTEPILGLFTAGHEARGGDCPVCGCDRLHWDRLATPDEVPAAFENAPADQGGQP